MLINPITQTKHRTWETLHRAVGKALPPAKIGEWSEIVNYGKVLRLFAPALEREFIDLDRKGRGSCLNHDLYAYDPAQGVAIVQARLYYKRRASHFGATRKTYFLCGQNEITKEFFRHPVGAHIVRAACKRSTDPHRADVVRSVQCWMWEVSEAKLGSSVRQGDILLVPEKEPKIKESKGTSLTVSASHEIRADEIRLNGRCYALNPTVTHTKGQHAPVALSGWCSVRVAREAFAWNFAERIGD